MTDVGTQRANRIAIATLVLALVLQAGAWVWYGAQLSRQVQQNTKRIEQLFNVRERLGRVEATMNANNRLLKALLRKNLTRSEAFVAPQLSDWQARNVMDAVGG